MAEHTVKAFDTEIGQLRGLIALDDLYPGTSVTNELVKFDDRQARKIDRHAEFPLVRSKRWSVARPGQGEPVLGR